jgi:hypothetical protein
MALRFFKINLPRKNVIIHKSNYRQFCWREEMHIERLFFSTLRFIHNIKLNVKIN